MNQMEFNDFDMQDEHDSNLLRSGRKKVRQMTDEEYIKDFMEDE